MVASAVTNKQLQVEKRRGLAVYYRRKPAKSHVANDYF